MKRYRYLSYTLMGMILCGVNRTKNAFLMDVNTVTFAYNTLVKRDDYSSLLHHKNRVVYLEKITREQNQTNLLQQRQRSARTIDPLSNQAERASAQPASYSLLPYEKPYHHQCSFMKPWQTQFNPTCNQLHELDTTQETTSLLSMSGSWRSVWKSIQGNESVVLKMLHINREFDSESFAFHQQVDAMALERLTKSKICDHRLWLLRPVHISRVSSSRRSISHKR